MRRTFCPEEKHYLEWSEGTFGDVNDEERSTWDLPLKFLFAFDQSAHAYQS